MVFEQLNITNFQSHKNTIIGFHSGVNVIVGPTDSGKSAIYRALTMVLFNRPSGDALVSHWAKKNGKIVDPMSVELAVDQFWIKRFRGKENLYISDGSEYRAFGANVPEDIAEFLNVSEINVQSQHDNMFLLSESAGEVARKLNAVVKLDKMTKAQAEIIKLGRESTQNIKRVEAEVGQLGKDLAELSWIAEAERDVINLETFQEQYDERNIQSDELFGLISQIRRIYLDEYDWIPEAEKDVAELGGLITDQIDTVPLSDLISQAIEVENLLSDFLSIEYLDQFWNDVDGLEKLEKKTTDFVGGPVADLVLLIDDIENNGLDSAGVQADLEELERQMPNVCPLCGQPIKKDSL